MLIRAATLAVLLSVVASDASARFEMQEASIYPTPVLLTGMQLAQADLTPPRPTYSYADGLMRGISAAQSEHGTGASFAGGIVWGLGLGLIGTGVGYFTTGTSNPPNSHMMEIAPKGPDFGSGYTAGYRQEARRKNKGAKLGGGLLGFGMLLALLLG